MFCQLDLIRQKHEVIDKILIKINNLSSEEAPTIRKIIIK